MVSLLLLKKTQQIKCTWNASTAEAILRWNVSISRTLSCLLYIIFRKLSTDNLLANVLTSFNSLIVALYHEWLNGLGKVKKTDTIRWSRASVVALSISFWVSYCSLRVLSKWAVEEVMAMSWALLACACWAASNNSFRIVNAAPRHGTGVQCKVTVIRSLSIVG